MSNFLLELTGPVWSNSKREQGWSLSSERWNLPAASRVPIAGGAAFSPLVFFRYANFHMQHLRHHAFAFPRLLMLRGRHWWTARGRLVDCGDDLYASYGEALVTLAVQSVVTWAGRHLRFAGAGLAEA